MSQNNQPGSSTQAVKVPVSGAALEGNLTIPATTAGVVLFAHGSGSSRHSPRNRLVADTLNRAGFATLLMDLLTLQEEAVDQPTGYLRFDIGLLAGRLVSASDWLGQNPATARLRIGYFGASTGGGAALVAAAARPEAVKAIVVRGGRPDLAGDALPRVKAPTLLIVGGNDQVVIDLNRLALARLALELDKRLEIVPGASHLFEEGDSLKQVAHLATGWFKQFLPDHRAAWAGEGQANTYPRHL